MQPHQSMTDKVKNVLGVGHGTTHTTTGSAPVVHHGTGTGYGTTTGTGYGTAVHTDGGMLERVGEAITGHGTHGTHGTGYDATGTGYGHTTGTGYGHTTGTGYGATGVGHGPAERQAGMLGKVEDAIMGHGAHGTGTGYGHTTGTGYGHTTGTGYGHTTGTGYGHTTGTGYGATGVGHGPAERQAGMLGRVEDAITGHGAHTTGTGYGTTTGTGYGHTTGTGVAHGTGVTHSSELSMAEKAKLKLTGHL